MNVLTDNICLGSIEPHTLFCEFEADPDYSTLCEHLLSFLAADDECLNIPAHQQDLVEEAYDKMRSEYLSDIKVTTIQPQFTDSGEDIKEFVDNCESDIIVIDCSQIKVGDIKNKDGSEFSRWDLDEHTDSKYNTISCVYDEGIVYVNRNSKAAIAGDVTIEISRKDFENIIGLSAEEFEK